MHVSNNVYNVLSAACLQKQLVCIDHPACMLYLGVFFILMRSLDGQVCGRGKTDTNWDSSLEEIDGNRGDRGRDESDNHGL